MKRPIYIVLHTLSIGGAERHAASIANYLSENGYNVKILLLENNIVEYELAKNIEVINISNDIGNTKDNIKLIERVLLRIYHFAFPKKYELLDRYLYLKFHYFDKLSSFFSEQTDIEKSTIISFMTIPNMSSSILTDRFHYKLILGEFTSPQLEFESDAPENSLKRKYFPNADGFVFQTDEQKEFYSFVTNAIKQVIPNPIEKITVQPYQGKRRKEIVNYCKHVKAKNLPLLIESFAKLSMDFPDYTLVIYGDGPTKNETIKCIEKFSLFNKVILKPYAKNVLDLVRDSAMFVTSSDREGISNSMLEAMAIGLPTISTDCPAGGARMFIKSYENGIIVPVRDPEAMYQAMKYIIDNPDEAKKMGQNAVEIRNTLEKSKILSQWLNFIESI